MKKISSTPFRQLELQLQLEKLENQWEEAKKNYYEDDKNTDMVDEILKLSVEKIKVLSEIYMNMYDA